MTRVVHSVEIKATVESAFSYISDGLNTPDWHPSIKVTKRTTDGPLGAGSKLRVEAVVGKRTYDWEQEVTEFIPNRSFKDTMISGPFRRFEDWAVFEETDLGTRWTFGIIYELPGGVFGKLYDLLVIRKRVRRHHLEAMSRAKEILERN